MHLANLPLADYSNKIHQRQFQSILVGTTNILEIIKNLVKIPRFIFASSSMIYGDFKYFLMTKIMKKIQKISMEEQNMLQKHLFKLTLEALMLPILLSGHQLFMVHMMLIEE